MTIPLLIAQRAKFKTEFGGKSLDVASRVELHDIMREQQAVGTTIILATHDMAEAEEMSDRVAILLNGSIQTVGSPMEITATGAGLTKVSVHTENSSVSDPDIMFPAVSQRGSKEEYSIFFSTDIGPTVSAIISHIETQGDALIDLRVERPSLEDRFLAMVVLAILAATFLGLPDPLVSAREAGIFRSYKINGVPSLSILKIPALTTMLHLVIVAVIITASAPLLFDAPLPVNWINYGLTFVAFAFACAGISVLIGVISLGTRMKVLWSQLIFTPSMLLAGLMLPYSMLPQVVGKIAQLLPATYAMNTFNGLAMGMTADFAPWGSVIVLFISGLLAFGLAIYLLSWDSRNSTRRRHPLLALLILLPYVVGLVVL